MQHYTKYGHYRNKVVGMLMARILEGMQATQQNILLCIPTLYKILPQWLWLTQGLKSLNIFASCFNQSHSPLDNADSHVIPCPGEPGSSILCDKGLVCDFLASLDMSKSTGPDGVSAQMLKWTAACTAPSVTLLFNQSGEHLILFCPFLKFHKLIKSPDHYRSVSLLKYLRGMYTPSLQII